MGFPGGSAGEESTCSAEDLGLINPWADDAVPGPSVFPSREPGVSGDFGGRRIQKKELEL